MGKSLYVKRMTNNLKKKFKTPVTYPLCVTIPVHGPNVDFDKVMESLLCHANPVDPLPQIFHFDVAPSVRQLRVQSIITAYFFCYVDTGRCRCLVV